MVVVAAWPVDASPAAPLTAAPPSPTTSGGGRLGVEIVVAFGSYSVRPAWRAPAVGLVLVEPHVPLGEGTGEWRDQGHRGPGGPQIVLARSFSRSTSAVRGTSRLGQERNFS